MIQSQNPRETDERLLLDGGTPRTVRLRVASGRLSVWFDGKGVADEAVSWLGREGKAVYPCVFTAPREENGACAMALLCVTAGRADAR